MAAPSVEAGIPQDVKSNEKSPLLPAEASKMPEYTFLKGLSRAAATSAPAKLSSFARFLKVVHSGAAGVSQKDEMSRKFQETMDAEEASNVGFKDSMSYRTQYLSSWRTIANTRGTVWSTPGLWRAFFACNVVALVTCVVVLVLVQDPSTMESSKFRRMGTFLNVFVGLMLGFFLSSSINRWYRVAQGFLELFDAIRNLQMQFHALGVPHESENRCLRYGVLSGWLLSLEIHAAHISIAHRSQTLDMLWAHMEEVRPGLVEEPESAYLRNALDCGEPAGLVWTWVASKVGSMAQCGEIPPMASPTYGRILNIVEVAHGGIRTVRAAITVQAPFIYVHMLSSLVHLNNIINSVTFGITLGALSGDILQAHGLYHSDAPHAAASKDHISTDVQNVLVAFCMCIIGPFVYHALLEVGICIAQPFDHDAGKIPTERLLTNLEKDLVDGKSFSQAEMSWKKPDFSGKSKG